MGKSTILKMLLGHDVTYSATGESTMLITEYYVHYIDDNSPCRFYFNACNDVDSSKEIHDEIDSQTLAIVPAEIVLGNKIKAENGSQQAITTTSAPLQIAIYTNKALVYGLLIDFPGLRGNTPAGIAVNNDDAIIDRMETLLAESSNDSTIIVTETICKQSGGHATSIEYLTEKMKAKNKLKSFLEKCVIVINQTNLCFREGDKWNLLEQEEDAFHHNNLTLLDFIDISCIEAGVPKIKPIFLFIDMDSNKILKPWNNNYDRKMKVLLEPKLEFYIDRVVCDGMEYVINDIVGKQKNAVVLSKSEFKNLLSPMVDNYKKSMKAETHHYPYIMESLQQAEIRLFRFIKFYMTNFDENTFYVSKFKVCIDRDNEPKLHDFLKEVFAIDGPLNRSKYHLCGKLASETSIEELMKCLESENMNMNDEIFRTPLERNGTDELIETAKAIFSFMLNLKLTEFDEIRFRSQTTAFGDAPIGYARIKSGIDGIVINDIRAIMGGIMKYLHSTLNWIYPQIIDAALLQSMNFNDNVGPNVLNVAESMLELRFRCTQALQFWITEVLVLLNNNIEKGCASSPEEVKSISRLHSNLLDDFYPSPNEGFFDVLSHQNRTSPNLFQKGLQDALNVVYDLEPSGTLKSIKTDHRNLINQNIIKYFSELFSSATTRNDPKEQIMKAFFGTPEPIDHLLLKPIDRLKYASELFSIQIASILGEINNIFKREFVPFASKQVSQRIAFERIFHSYVYHDVGVPHLTSVVDTNSIFATSSIEKSSSHPFTIQASDRDDHEKRLAEIYKWNRDNPAQNLIDNSEKILCDDLLNDDKVKSFMA